MLKPIFELQLLKVGKYNRLFIRKLKLWITKDHKKSVHMVLGEYLKFLGNFLENFTYTSLKNKNFMTKKLNNNKCVK